MSAATERVETHSFQAETARLLDLMIHSLYTNKEIFLRELISNASDALDKVHFESLTHPDLLGDDTELHIRLSADAEARTLTVSDNGIGMTHDEVIENIGTIAKSGTRELFEQLKEDQASDRPAEMIGQFGVGFYSCFMVADRVTLITRHAGEEGDGATQWESDGAGQYTITPVSKEGRGTSVTLHLKEADADAGLEDFTQEWVLGRLVRSHSDYVAYPIRQQQTREEVERDEQGKPKEDGVTETITEDVTLNSMQPIWSRNRSEVTDEEYAEFYRHISHDWQPPAKTLNLRAEGRTEYSTLLFFPSQAPADLYYQNHSFGLQLYVRRVLIMDQYEALLPRYLRFVKGIVDSSDLPLNISRQRLQEDRHITQIRQWITGQLLDALKSMQEEELEDYLTWWQQFGPVLKEGLGDPTAKERLKPLLMFASSNDPEGFTSLASYVERMKEDQEAIYYITGDSRMTVENAPQLENFKAKGYEVLYLTDPVDAFLMHHLDAFDQKSFQSVTQGTVELGDEKEREEAQESLKAQGEQHADLLTAIQDKLDEWVKEVRLTNRLTDSPACLVGSEFDLNPQLMRMLRESGADTPDQKRILELNPDHPLLKKLQSIRAAGTEESGAEGSAAAEAVGAEADADPLADYAFLLYSNALLAEGGELPDPARFNRLFASLLLK
jgi:molecular chaperone HtpG